MGFGVSCLSFIAALAELGLSKVHTLLLSFPLLPNSSLKILEHITAVWEEVQLLVKEGVAEVVGVADLDKDQLEELFDWATVKPKVDQVNLAHCCTIPEVGVVNMLILICLKIVYHFK